MNPSGSEERLSTAEPQSSRGLHPLLIGAALCVVASASGGLAPTLVRRLTDEDVSTSAMLAVRYPVAAMVLWAIVVFRPRRPMRRTSLLLTGGVGATLYLLQSAAYLLSIQRLGGNLAVGVLFVYPTIVVLLTWVFKGQQIGIRDIGAALLGAAGVALLLEVGRGAIPSVLGVGLALTAALAYAVYTVLADTLLGAMDVYLFAAVICLGSGLAAIIFAICAGTSWPTTPLGWVCILGLGVFPTLITTIAFLAGVTRLGARAAVVLSCTEPLFANLFEAVFFGARPGLLQLIGTVAIVTSAVIAMLGRRAAVPDAPVSPAALAEPRRIEP